MRDPLGPFNTWVSEGANHEVVSFHDGGLSDSAVGSPIAVRPMRVPPRRVPYVEFLLQAWLIKPKLERSGFVLVERV